MAGQTHDEMLEAVRNLARMTADFYHELRRLGIEERWAVTLTQSYTSALVTQVVKGSQNQS